MWRQRGNIVASHCFTCDWVFSHVSWSENEIISRLNWTHSHFPHDTFASSHFCSLTFFRRIRSFHNSTFSGLQKSEKWWIMWPERSRQWHRLHVDSVSFKSSEGQLFTKWKKQHHDWEREHFYSFSFYLLPVNSNSNPLNKLFRVWKVRNSLKIRNMLVIFEWVWCIHRGLDFLEGLMILGNPWSGKTQIGEGDEGCSACRNDLLWLQTHNSIHFISNILLSRLYLTVTFTILA